MSFLPALALAGGIAIPLAFSAGPPQAPTTMPADPAHFWSVPAASPVLSPSLAVAQIKRVAAYRHLPAASVRRLVADNGGASGDVDVHALNHALDALRQAN